MNECTAELKANLQEEHLAGMEFIGTVFKTILSPLQKARVIVQSYPFYPDVYQVGAGAKERLCWKESVESVGRKQMASCGGIPFTRTPTRWGVLLKRGA